MITTAEDVAQSLRALAEAATPGPWKTRGHAGYAHPCDATPAPPRTRPASPRVGLLGWRRALLRMERAIDTALSQKPEAK